MGVIDELKNEVETYPRDNIELDVIRRTLSGSRNAAMSNRNTRSLLIAVTSLIFGVFSSGWTNAATGRADGVIDSAQALEKYEPLERGDLEGVKLPAFCDEDMVWFAGRCRDDTFFSSILPSGQELISVNGSRSKLAQTVAVVFAKERNSSVFEYLIDDEGQGLAVDQIQNPGIRNLTQSGAAQLTSRGLRYHVSADYINNPNVLDELTRPERAPVRGGVPALLDRYSIITRTLYSQGYINGRAYTFAEQLENIGGTLQLFQSKLSWEPEGSSQDVVVCRSANFIQDRLAGSGEPGCYEVTETASSGSTSNTTGSGQACGAMQQGVTWLAGWASSLGCDAAAAAALNNVGGSSGLQVAVFVTLISGGQVELGIVAGTITWGGILAGGAPVGKAGCALVTSLITDVINQMQGCSQGLPLTDKQLRDIYQHIENGMTMLQQLAVAVGCHSTGITEVLSGPSEHCGGDEIRCTRHGQQHCSVDGTGTCACGSVDWINNGNYDCVCQ